MAGTPIDALPTVPSALLTDIFPAVQAGVTVQESLQQVVNLVQSSLTGAALTRTNDTNVTLTLGGSPTTALLNATSLTLGWTGLLAGSRGGTGVNNGASTITIGGNVTYSGAFTFTGTLTNNTAVTFPTSGTLATTSQIPTGAALTKVDDTNVTLTLGGSPTTALLAATSMTLGWTGQLSLTRGGTAASLVASNGGIVYSTASAMAILAGTATAGQILRSGASAAPTWSTATYPATTTINQILFSSAANVIGGIAAVNGGVLVSSNTGVPSMLANPAAANRVLLSANAAIPAWSTAVYPATTTINQILFSSAANTITGITAANSAMLVSSSTGVPAMTATMTNGQIVIGSTGATPTPATLTAGNGITVTNGAASITIASTGGGVTWTNVSGTTQTMVADNGYIANNVALVTMTLPATAAIGTILAVAGNGAGGWRIAQNASQNIKFGNQTTTTGVGGSVSSTNLYDCIEILCTVANTTWVVRAAQGNITYV